MIDTPGNLESLHNARRLSHWDFRFWEECIVVSGSGESASGVDEFQTCQFCQEPRPRWSSMCAYTRLVWPPRLNQLLTDTEDGRRVFTPDKRSSKRVSRFLSHAMIVPWPKSDCESRLQRHSIPLPPLLSLYRVTLFWILLPYVPSIGNRFYLVGLLAQS